MEGALCPILNTLRLHNHNNVRRNKYNHIARAQVPFHPTLSNSSTNYTFRGRSLQFSRLNASSSISEQNPSKQLAILLEVEGVLMDVYRLGNREAFNAALKKMGLDCAYWTEPIYLDLVSLQKIVAALRAGAECAEVPVPNCMLVAGSQPGVAAAEQIGMPCVVLHSRLTSRAEFPSANAIMDSFGGADLTISRLRNIIWS